VDGNATLSVIRGGDMTKMLIEGIEEERVGIHLVTSLSLGPGRRRSFPIPITLSDADGVSLTVLLPKGWTSQGSAPECSRILDRETGRIQLAWTGLTESPSAIAVTPGLGEDEMKKVIFRMALSSFWPIALALIAPFLALAIYAIYLKRKGGNGPSQESAETLLFGVKRGRDGTRHEEEEPAPHRNRQP
jgi:hypothetical protein